MCRVYFFFFAKNRFFCDLRVTIPWSHKFSPSLKMSLLQKLVQYLNVFGTFLLLSKMAVPNIHLRHSSVVALFVEKCPHQAATSKIRPIIHSAPISSVFEAGHPALIKGYKFKVKCLVRQKSVTHSVKNQGI